MKDSHIGRRLAAILVADIVGYSRLMGGDEIGTLRALKAHRRELVDPSIAAHHGRMVKTTGDGLLVEFASIVDAVACAVRIQRGMIGRNADLPDDKRVVFRIGINIGDILFDGDDIFGDGVNVAARLEAMCEPGGLCISRAANDQIRDKLTLPFALLGISQGCAVSIAYATRHPERVTRMVLYGGYAQGAGKRARSAADREQLAALLTLVRLGWGQENPAFRQIFTSQFVPGGSKEQVDWFNEMQRASTSPENAVRFFQAIGDVDVSHLLGAVRVPTLVMHARADARVPFDLGRRLAAGIPNARFVPLESRNHLILEDEPAYARFVEEIRSFLRET